MNIINITRCADAMFTPTGGDPVVMPEVSSVAILMDQARLFVATTGHCPGFGVRGVFEVTDRSEKLRYTATNAFIGNYKSGEWEIFCESSDGQTTPVSIDSI